MCARDANIQFQITFIIMIFTSFAFFIEYNVCTFVCVHTKRKHRFSDNIERHHHNQVNQNQYVHLIDVKIITIKSTMSAHQMSTYHSH